MVDISSLISDRSNLDREVNHGKYCKHRIEMGIDQVASFRHDYSKKGWLNYYQACPQKEQSNENRFVT